jgi:hypothetical protein
MVSLAGPRAMIRCKPRQARKGATVAADSCAVVWLAGGATLNPPCFCLPSDTLYLLASLLWIDLGIAGFGHRPL